MILDREQKKIKENYTAHSQGSLILGNALNLVVKNGKAEVLKGKKIHMNGSPESMKVNENKGYNKYQEYNNEIKKYEVNSDKYKKIHLISNTRYIEGDK